jgi:hypothetical protein
MRTRIEVTNELRRLTETAGLEMAKLQREGRQISEVEGEPIVSYS